MYIPADYRSRYTFPKLQRVDDPAGRYYVEPSSPEARYSSITTMLGATADKSHLDAWKQRVGEEEAARRSRIAATRGTKLHSLLEDRLVGVPFPPNTQFDILPLVKGIERQTIPRISEIRGMEVQMFSRDMRLAGTSDLICVIDGRLSVLDWKTSGSDKEFYEIDDYFLQGAAYAKMWHEHTGEVIKDLAIVIASEATPTPLERFAKTRDWVDRLYRRVEAFHKLANQ